MVQSALSTALKSPNYDMTVNEFDRMSDAAFLGTFTPPCKQEAAQSSGNSSEANCATESPAETRDYFSAYPDFIDCELELHAHVYGTVANEAHSGIKFDQTVQTPFFNPVAEHTTENLFESKNQTGVPSDYLCAPKVGFQSSSSSERASPCMVVDPTNYVTMNLPNAKDPISMKPKPSAEPAAAAIHGQATVFNTATGLSFKSAEEANAFAPQKWAEPLKDPTIPQTQQDQEAIVMELMQAMYSIEQSKDNEGMVRPWKQGRHSQIRVEIACWNILKACINRHETGPLRYSWDSKDNIREDSIATFKNRMSTILQILKERKTICKRLLDVPFFLNFIDDPSYQENRVEQNKGLNAKKGMVIKAGKTALEKEEKESGTTVTAPRKRVRGMKIPAIDSDITVGTPKPIKRQRKPLTKTPMLAASQPSTLSAMQPEPSFYPTPQSMSGQYTPGHHRGHSDATPYGTPQAQPGSYFAHPMAINQCSGHGTASSAVLSPPPFPTPRSDMVSQAANTSFDSLGGMANYPLVQVHGGQPSMQQQWQVSSGFPPSAHAMQSIPNDGMHAFNIQPPSHLHQFQPQVQNLHYSLPRFTSAASLQSLVGVQGSGEFVLGPPLQPPHASGIQTEASPNPGAAAHFHESSSANENSAALPDNK